MIQCLELSKQKSKLWMILIPPLVLMASQSRLSLIGNLSSFHGLILALILSLREQEFFVDGHGARKCIQAGAKKVIITAPAKGADIPTYVVGVNKGDYSHVVSNIIKNCQGNNGKHPFIR
ncbi:hypothetical protein SLEP1_g51621 [Rubroshorea leprosula]|uniref:Uncharacterized protein n=1 Tax=Rubroshorea leprosula TaxID=152421 RepID=A0AAV5M3Q8_9ROSI|nr:hypothetical protein SLEP1_g51621 [Rubroshorea leprosula]